MINKNETPQHEVVLGGLAFSLPGGRIKIKPGFDQLPGGFRSPRQPDFIKNIEHFRDDHRAADLDEKHPTVVVPTEPFLAMH